MEKIRKLTRMIDSTFNRGAKLGPESDFGGDPKVDSYDSYDSLVTFDTFYFNARRSQHKIKCKLLLSRRRNKTKFVGHCVGGSVTAQNLAVVVSGIWCWNIEVQVMF